MPMLVLIFSVLLIFLMIYNMIASWISWWISLTCWRYQPIWSIYLFCGSYYYCLCLNFLNTFDNDICPLFLLVLINFWFRNPFLSWIVPIQTGKIIDHWRVVFYQFGYGLHNKVSGDTTVVYFLTAMHGHDKKS